jgi:hypothetical protein
MDVKYGVIQRCEWTTLGDDEINQQLTTYLNDTLGDRKLHEIEDWETTLNVDYAESELGDLVAFFNRILPQR